MKNLVGKAFPRSEFAFCRRMREVHRRWDSLRLTSLTYPFAERLLEENRLWWELKRYYEEGLRRGYPSDKGMPEHPDAVASPEKQAMMQARLTFAFFKVKKRWTITEARRQERARARLALQLSGWNGDYASYKKECLRMRDIILRTMKESR